MQIKPGIRDWQVGRRVARKDGEELGVVVEVGQLGTIKVKWDRGSTSYYRLDRPGNVKLAVTERQDC
jgi:hypothetical protein